MKRAAEATTTAFDKMKKSGESLRSVMGVLGVGLGLRELFSSFTGAIDAADNLNDLSKKTAISVETLSGLRLAAEQSGVSMETLAKALAKLGKAQNAATDGDVKMKALLDTLRIDGLKAEDQLIGLARAFETMSDEDRVQVADRLGKGFRELVPLLSEGADGLRKMIEEGKRLNLITSDMAKRADEYNDSMAKLKAASANIWTKLADDALPALNRVVNGMKEAVAEGDYLRAVIVGIGGALFELATESEIAGMTRKMKVAQKELAELRKAPKDNAMAAKWRAGLEAEIADWEKLIAQRRMQVEQQKKLLAAATGEKPRKAENTDLRAQLCAQEGGRWTGSECVPKQEVDALRKKILEQNLKSLDASIAQEKEALQERNQILDLSNSENVISIKDYFRSKEQARQEALDKSLAYYDQEIALQEKFMREASGKGSDAVKTDAQTAINELQKKQQKLRDEARMEGVKSPFEERRALRELENQYAELSASVLEFGGNLREAAEIRFDVANFDKVQRFVTEGSSGGLALLATLRAQAIAIAELNELSADASIVSDKRANAERSITMLQERGDLGLFDSLRRRGEARQKEIEQLQEVYDKMAAIVAVTGNAKMKQDLENLGLEIDELKEKASALKEVFDEVFVGSFTDGLASFIDGTKSAKDAFKDFVRSVEQQLAKLAAQDISRSIFGGGSSSGGSGLFGWLANFFSGAGASSAAAGGGGDPPIWAAKGRVFDSSGVQAFAMGDVFGSPTRFKFAGGMGVMGEAGPEAVMPLARDRSGRLGVRGGGTTVNQVTFNISTPDANSFRQSESQIAASMYQALSRSARSR